VAGVDSLPGGGLGLAVPPFFLCLFGGHGRRTPGWIVAVGCFVIDEMEGPDYPRPGDATDNSWVARGISLKVWMGGYSFTRGWKWIMCVLLAESYIYTATCPRKDKRKTIVPMRDQTSFLCFGVS
jgi:hypothetical protein